MAINDNYFTKDFFLTDSHAKILPTVRIKKVELKNFKSVKHGEILLNCGKQYVPYGSKSDILGVYGQNGSGKTSLIEALSILEMLMAGASVPDVYADCISIDELISNLTFTFDLQYQSGEIRELEYAFAMDKIELSQEEIQERYKDAPKDYPIPADNYRVHVFNEILKLSWDEAGKRKIKQTIVDTSAENMPFGPSTKLEAFVGKDRKAVLDLEINKKLTADKSRSFIFSKKTLQVFKDSDMYSIFYQVLLEMRYFATLYFFVIDTKSSGLICLNFNLPIYTRTGVLRFDVRRPEIFSNATFDYFNMSLSGVSAVLTQLVPGLTIGFKKISETLTKDGDAGCVAMPVAYHNGIEIPLRDESDGVRKIISVLSLIIAAYNDQSFTLAIDEFDSGIFEYLLGEILQTFEESGKGQFIFTSHNLRPLEVIDKKFLVFTTTNPEKRYYRLKSISSTNNLRDTYFREIILGEQEEELYKKTKRFKIEAAMKKAGVVEL
jgi:hypothetical protein